MRRKPDIFRRIAGLVLVAALTVGLAVPAGVSAAGSSVKFSDDFSSSALDGWKDGSVGSVSGGKYSLSGKVTNTVTAAGCSDLSNITVSAKMSVQIGADAKKKKMNSFTGLVIAGNRELTKGYAFGLGVSKTGTTFVRLTLLGQGSENEILYQLTTRIPGVPSGDNGKIKENTEYSLTVGKQGDLIRCFINGELVFEHSDGSYVSGYIGIINDYTRAVIDDFTVATIGTRSVKSIALAGDPPESMSQAGLLPCDILVTYDDPFYGTEAIAPDAEGVSYSGFERTGANRTITVSYGGKSVSFVTNVTARYQSTVLYHNDFKDPQSEEDDWIANSATALTGAKYELRYRNGQFRADFPAGYDASALISRPRLKPDITSSWTVYSVQATAAIYSSAKTRQGMAEITFFSDSDGNPYRFRLSAAGVFELYRNTDLLDSATLAKAGLPAIGAGSSFTLKVTVRSGIFTCYCNNREIFNYMGMYYGDFIPEIRLGALNGTVAFTDVRVTSEELKNPYAAKSMKLYDLQGNVVTSYKGNALNLSDMYLSVTFVNGDTEKIPVTDSMVRNYDRGKKQNQKVTVKYGNISVTVDYIYIKYIFEDTFDKNYAAKWNIPRDSGFNFKVQGGKLRIEKLPATAKNVSVNSLLNGTDDYGNVAVSADISMDGKMSGQTNPTIALIGRYKDGANFYALMYRVEGNGRPGLQFYKFAAGSPTQVAYVNYVNICAVLGESISITKTYNIKLVMQNNVFSFYVNGKYVGGYTDDSETAIARGKVGFRVLNVSGYIDNYRVEQVGEPGTVSVTVEGVKNNTFEFYEGFDILSGEYTLELHDRDGYVTTRSLESGMVSGYDNMKVGTQNIRIKVDGKEFPAKVVVKSRRDVVKRLSDDLEKAPEGDALADKDAVYALRERYNELSPFEVSLLSEKGVERLNTALKNLEDLMYPQVKDSPLVYNEYFDDTDEADWYDGPAVQGKVGKWSLGNGVYAYYSPSALQGASGFRFPKNVHGKFVSAEARVKIQKNGFTALCVNANEYGFYYVRLGFNSYEDGKPILLCQIYKYIKGHQQVASVELRNIGLEDVTLGQWVYLRMIIVDNIAHAFINDVEATTFDTSNDTLRFDEGWCGFRFTEINGYAMADNLRLRGELTPSEEEEYVPDPVKYNDDFEDEKVGTSPSHWCEDYTFPAGVKDNWKVTSKGGSRVYTSNVTSDETRTWLHVFDKDPTFTARIMPGSVANGSEFGVMVRWAPDTCYVKIGYSPETQRWFLADCQGEFDFETVTYQSERYPMQAGKWYNIEVKCDYRSVTVSVGGKTLFALDSVKETDWGRVGFYAKNTALSVDDFKATFANGLEPTDGVMAAQTELWAHTELEQKNNGDIVILHRSHSYVSGNNGESYTALPDDVNRALLGTSSSIGYLVTQKLRNGKFMWIQDEDFSVYVSDDDLKSWKKVGQIIPSEGQVDAKGRHLPIIHVNTLQEVKLKNGKLRLFCPVAYRLYNSNNSDDAANGHYTKIYYSDDEGRTWQESKTDTRSLQPYYDPTNTASTMAEMKVVSCADGDLRAYFTHGLDGVMRYIESHDDGITWEGYYYMPNMQCPDSSYNVAEDPYNPGTWYMVWVNTAEHPFGTMFPRTRLSLVRSTDGKNWEYLTDVERMGSGVYSELNVKGTEVFQIIDPNVLVTEKYVYVSMPVSSRSTVAASEAHNLQNARVLRFEKSKLKSHPWSAANIGSMNFIEKMEVTKQPDSVKFGIGDIFTLSGIEVTATTLAGKKKILTENDFTLYEDPDMFTLGKQTLTLWNIHALPVTLDIEIVNSYALVWNISEGGSLDLPGLPPTKILEGDSPTYKLLPEKGYKAGSVTVNGTEVKIKGGEFTIPAATGDVTVTVTFEKLSGAEQVLNGNGRYRWVLYVIIGVVAAGAAAAAIAVAVKKKKRVAAENGGAEPPEDKAAK